MFSNPFEAIGIPSDVVKTELDKGQSDKLVKLAQNLAKAWAGVYHPDLGGDEEVFKRIVAARDEIIGDPEAAASFFSSHKTAEVATIRNLSAKDRKLSEDEKTTVFSLLQNVDPMKVAPWIRGNEVLVANWAYSPDSRLCIALRMRDGKVTSRAGLSNYLFDKVVYARTKGWQAIGRLEHDEPLEHAIKMTPFEEFLIIGGIEEEHTPAATNTSRLEHMLSVENAIEAERSTKSKTIHWELADRTDWLAYVKPQAKPEDYLVIAKLGANTQPQLTIIGPILGNHRLS